MMQEKRKQASVASGSERTSIRLGWGDYQPYDAKIITEMHARKEFMFQIEEHAPEMLESLAQEPFLLYQAFLDEVRHRYGDAAVGPSWDDEVFLYLQPTEQWSEHMRDINTYREILRVYPEAWFDRCNIEFMPSILPDDLDYHLTKFHNTVLAWSERWWFREAWCLQVIHRTLDWWYNDPERCKLRKWDPDQPLMVQHLPALESYIHLRIRRYDPTVETWQQVEERLQTIFEDVTRQLLREGQLMARAFQLQPTPIKRQPLHFEWLVRYQIQQSSRGQIAEQYHISEDVVKKAINRLAKIVVLRLRPQRPSGRPKGSKK